MTAPNNYPCQTTSPMSPLHVPTPPSSASSQTSLTQSFINPSYENNTLPTTNCPQQEPFSVTADNHSPKVPSSKCPSNLTFSDICDNNIFQFSCDQCTYKCRAKSALKRHITIKHKVILNLPCEPCPSITSSPAKVPTLPILPCPQHESVIYNCVFCDTIYPSKFSFVKHMITCTPELTNIVYI